MWQPFHTNSIVIVIISHSFRAVQILPHILGITTDVEM